MASIVKHKTGGYRVFWRNPPGMRPSRGSLVVGTKKEAEQIQAAKNSDELKANQTRKRIICDVTLVGAFRRFLESLVAERKASRTIKKYEGVIAQFTLYVGDMPITDITREHITAWKASRLKESIHVNTMADNLKNLKVFFNWCVRENYLYDSPVAGVSQKTTRREPRVASKSEVEQALKEIRKYREDFYEAVMLMALAGLRIGEVRQLRWEHFDLRNKVIRITADITKTGNERIVPMHATIHEHFNAKTARGIFLFPSPVYPDRPQSNEFKQKINRWTKRKGLPNCHAYRHFFGTTLAQNGATIADIKRAMGHVSLEMTERYIHSSRERREQLIGLIEIDL